MNVYRYEKKPPNKNCKSFLCILSRIKINDLYKYLRKIEVHIYIQIDKQVDLPPIKTNKYCINKP